MTDRVIFSTADARGPAEGTFAAYHDLYAPVADVCRLDDGFSVTVEAHRLGEIIAFNRKLKSVSHRRDLKRVARNGFDHFTVQLALKGMFRISTSGGDREVGPGALALIDMTQAMRTDAIDAEIITLSVPRDHFDATGAARRLHGAVLPSHRAVLFQDFILSCFRNEALLTPADMPRIERVAIDLLTLALSDRSYLEQAQPECATDVVCRSRAKAFIDTHLGATPDDVARAVGRSRSSLYRAFEPFGGMSEFIQSRRMVKLRRLLGSSEEARSISSLIFDSGFTSHSHGTRLFKSKFGVTPGEYRSAQQEGRAAEVLGVNPSTVFANWWASLR